MTPPSPYESAPKWARYLATQYSTGHWITSVVVAAGAAVIASLVPLPKHPTTADNLRATIIGIVTAAVVVLALSYGVALIRAPYRQRNKLRDDLTAARSQITQLSAAPVPQQHADDLRAIARRLQANLHDLQPLDYGPDATALRPAFHRHFPDMQADLDRANAGVIAFGALKRRIADATTAAGLDRPPWTPETYRPWLATMIQARALTRVAGNGDALPWSTLGPGSEFMGDPVYGNDQVLADANPADVPALKEKFEALFREIESAPEVTQIITASADNDTATTAASLRLTEIANTVAITGQCDLCRPRP